VGRGKNKKPALPGRDKTAPGGVTPQERQLAAVLLFGAESGIMNPSAERGLEECHNV
jgi:hypothetical protein